jgi:hypothetical protein
MPYWLITCISKKEFMMRCGLQGDLCTHTVMGQPVNRIDIGTLDALGTRIENGKTIELHLEDDVCTIFASTMDGSLSNEVILQDADTQHLTLTTKGGFKTVSYPYFEQE